MNTEPFLRPRLTGTRFEGGAIPLEFLKDLAVLEEMVVEVAKWRFLQIHSDRHRSPRGFTEGIELKLTGIEEGSVIPVINLFFAPDGLFPPENLACFEQARDAIVGAIGAAEHNQSITAHLPYQALTYFDRMGRSLRDGEAIEFTTPAMTTPARLTKETRRKLILASTTVKELTEETSVRGSVPEADQDNMSFQVQLFDGRKVRAPMATQHLDSILAAFNGYRNGGRVLLQGVGRFDRNERLQGFESIEHISLLDPLDIASRLEELRGLRDGWLDGKGMAPQGPGLDWLTQAFQQHFPEEVQPPYLYPMAEGGVQAEWSLAQHEITLEINLGNHAGDWHVLDMTTDSEESRALNLDTPGDWGWLVGQIKGLAGGVE